MLILVEFSVLRFNVYDKPFTCTISYFSSSLLPVVTFFFVCVKLPTISRPKMFTLLLSQIKIKHSH